jgi:uncharacterized protein YdeI (YjbR/CyaY-like superfamily)
MIKKRTNPKVDAYLSKVTKWREETETLRTLLLGCGLTEEVKWGKPCYTFQQSNVTVIQGFKAYCALLFFKGALLKDASGILVKTGPNTIVGRQIRFTSVREVVEKEAIVKTCIHQAIEVERAGLKVEVPKTAAVSIPSELQNKLNEIPALKAAFAALTPGRQRAYLFYFSAPKQSKTREARVEKCMKQILKGKGLND